MRKISDTRRVTVVALVAAGALGCSTLSAQEGMIPAPPGVELSWTPRTPRQGEIVRIELRFPPDVDPRKLTAALGAEELHFEPGRRGVASSLGAIPVDAESTITLRVMLEPREGDDGRTAMAGWSSTATVRVLPGNYGSERLRVDPRYGNRPDSVTQARIDREAERALSVGDSSHRRARLWRSPFVRPRPGRVTSGYGRARVFNDDIATRHMGTDFAGVIGAPIRATARGIVALRDTFFLGGRVLYLDHGGGLVTGYLHLSRWLVAPGDTVRAGQIIGRVGNTGRATGPHLHWVVRYGRVTANPMSLLALNAPARKPPATSTRARVTRSPRPATSTRARATRGAPPPTARAPRKSTRP